MLAAGLSPALTALLGFSPATQGSANASDPVHAWADGADETDEPDAPASAEQVVDVVLPCGVRVIAAKDASLPVAAVVLSIEVGTRDDPDRLPGLIHALAYHLQQGNRELAPGEGIATAHDAGGLAAMAVGPSQVRFESLVPVSRLDAQLRVEALRLRAPNTGRELWLKSLSYARNDVGVKRVVPREAAAAAWNDPGLNHDGRMVSQGLSEMLGQALGAQLSLMFDYRNATLIVVGPEDPQALLERVEPLFADLPARARQPTAQATPPKPTTQAPRIVKLDRQNGDTMVWAVPGTPKGRAWAQVLCGTLNRQKPGANEAPKARVRCTFADDPRRPLLVLRAIGFDAAVGPEPMIAARLARIAAAEAEPELAALIENQRARMEGQISFALRAPLDLASYLASATERSDTPSSRQVLRPREQILGLPLLPGGAAKSGSGSGSASGSDPESGSSEASSTPSDATAPAPSDATAPASSDATAPAPSDATAPVGPRASALLAAAIPQLLDTRAAVLLINPEQQAPPPFHAKPIAKPIAKPSAKPASDKPAPDKPAPDKPAPKPQEATDKPASKPQGAS